MLAWSLQDAVKGLSVLFLISPVIGICTSSLGVFFFFLLFQCCELTVWILEVVILIEQSSNRELSARPALVESEFVPKLEKYPTQEVMEEAEMGSRKITNLYLATVSFDL